MSSFVRRRAAELVASAAALVIFGQAWFTGVHAGLGAFLAALTATSLWIATRVASTFFNAGFRGYVSYGSMFAGVLTLATTGFVIRNMGLDRSHSSLVSLFFLCGVSVGLAFGAFGAYAQLKKRVPK